MALTKAELLAKLRNKSSEAKTQTPQVQETKEDSQPIQSNEPAPKPAPPSVVKFDNVIGTEYEPMKMKLAELEEALNKEAPGFAFLLRDIHQTMRKDANVVTILTDEEIGLVVRGLEKNLNLTIVPSKSGSGKSKSGRTQPISADDL